MTMTQFENRLRIILTHPHFVAVGVLTFLWVVFFWRLYTPVIEDRVIFPQGDFTELYFSFSSYQAERLMDGDIPLWNPYNHAGSPFAADPQASVFYPPRWISIALSGGNGWSLADLQREVAAHYWLASVLMYAFLRTTTGRTSAALIGSVIFAYGGFLTGYPMQQITILQSVVWLPLILLGIFLSLSYPKWGIRGLLLGGIGLGLSILGGHPQTNLHVGYLSLAYLLFLGYNRQSSLTGIVARLIILYSVGLAIGTVQLWSSLEFASLSSRVDDFSYIDKSSGLAIVETLQMIYPRLFGTWSPLYVGVVGLVMAIGALFRRTSDNLFWIAVVLVSLWVSFGNNSIVYDIFYLFVPGMGIFRQQERFAFGVAVGLAVLAANQMQWLVNLYRSQEKGLLTETEVFYRSRFELVSYGHAAVTVGLAALFIFIRVFNEQPLTTETLNTISLVALISVLFVLWLRWQATYVDEALFVSGALLLLIMVDLFTFGTRSANFVPNVPENYVQPPALWTDLRVSNPNDVYWRLDGEVGLQNYGTFFRMPDIYGTSPLYLESVDQIRQLPDEVVWELLAVRYVTTLDEALPEMGLDTLATGQNYDGEIYQIFEIDDRRPMAQLVFNAIVVDDPLEVMSEAKDLDLRENVVVGQEIPLELPGERPDDVIVSDVVFVSPEDLQLKVETPENALLTLSIPYYPGWEATIDDESVEIIEVYGGLMGVPLNGSDDVQRVRLRFQPQSTLYGSIISSLVAVFSVGYLVIGSLARRGAVGKYSE